MTANLYLKYVRYLGITEIMNIYIYIFTYLSTAFQKVYLKEAHTKRV
jgi:hypothetical protein